MKELSLTDRGAKDGFEKAVAMSNDTECGYIIDPLYE